MILLAACLVPPAELAALRDTRTEEGSVAESPVETAGETQETDPESAKDTTPDTDPPPLAITLEDLTALAWGAPGERLGAALTVTYDRDRTPLGGAYAAGPGELRLLALPEGGVVGCASTPDAVSVAAAGSLAASTDGVVASLHLYGKGADCATTATLPWRLDGDVLAVAMAPRGDDCAQAAAVVHEGERLVVTTTHLCASDLAAGVVPSPLGAIEAYAGTAPHPRASLDLVPMDAEDAYPEVLLGTPDDPGGVAARIVQGSLLEGALGATLGEAEWTAALTGVGGVDVVSWGVVGEGEAEVLVLGEERAWALVGRDAAELAALDGQPLDDAAAWVLDLPGRCLRTGALARGRRGVPTAVVAACDASRGPAAWVAALEAPTLTEDTLVPIEAAHAGALEVQTMADGTGTDLVLLGAPDWPEGGGVWMYEP